VLPKPCGDFGAVERCMKSVVEIQGQVPQRKTLSLSGNER
jgi:hypothetical protein